MANSTQTKFTHEVHISNEYGSIDTGWTKRGTNQSDPLELGHFIDQVATLLIQLDEAAKKGVSKNIINNYIQQISLAAKEQKTMNNHNREAYEAYLKKLSK